MDGEAPVEDPPRESSPAPAQDPAPATNDEPAPVVDDAPPPEIKAFIGGLAWEVTDGALEDEFKKYNIVSASVATHRDSGRSRGFGFVVFETEEGRDEAIKELHETEKWGRRITVAPAVPRDRMAPRRGGYGGGRDRYGGGGDRGYGGRGGDRGPRDRSPPY